MGSSRNITGISFFYHLNSLQKCNCTNCYTAMQSKMLGQGNKAPVQWSFTSISTKIHVAVDEQLELADMKSFHFFQGIKNSLLWLRIPSCSVMKFWQGARLMQIMRRLYCQGTLRYAKGGTSLHFSKTKGSLFLKVKSPLALLKSSRWNIPIRFQCLQTSAFKKAQQDTA